jgi:protoheme IX farnesyltransferase
MSSTVSQAASVSPAASVSSVIERAEASSIPDRDAPRRGDLRRTARDLVALTKPRITGNVVLTTFGGLWLASHSTWGLGEGRSPSAPLVAATLLGTALVVGGANALNMYLERDSDGFMGRTRARPLPAGRLAPSVALALGLWLSAIAIPLLTFVVNPLTGLLAGIALVSYVLLYTPMKRRSTAALVVGAVPGAIPPLLGWSAATGRLDGPALVLFAVLFCWQVPHFLAIATFRREEYARAGLKVLPNERGDRVTRHHVVRWLAALVLVSFLLVPFGVGGTPYLVAAALLGGGFFAVGAWGLRRDAGVRWARALFGVSLVYLVGLYAALIAGA